MTNPPAPLVLMPLHELPIMFQVVFVPTPAAPNKIGDVVQQVFTDYAFWDQQGLLFNLVSKNGLVNVTIQPTEIGVTSRPTVDRQEPPAKLAAIIQAFADVYRLKAVARAGARFRYPFQVGGWTLDQLFFPGLPLLSRMMPGGTGESYLVRRSYSTDPARKVGTNLMFETISPETYQAALSSPFLAPVADVAAEGPIVVLDVDLFRIQWNIGDIRHFYTGAHKAAADWREKMLAQLRGGV